MNHKVKCWIPYFESLWDGSKRFELRIQDRNYKVGDTLTCLEYDNLNHVFTGRKLSFTITYLLMIDTFVCSTGDYVILSLSEPLGLSRVRS